MDKIKFTERYMQFAKAQRPEQDYLIPAIGYYFIRGIKEKTDSQGNKFISAKVNWRLRLEDEWEDCVVNRFDINLSHLFNDYAIKPQKVNPADLRFKVIKVTSCRIEYRKIGDTTIPALSIHWDFSRFREDTDVEGFDMLPYYSLFQPYFALQEQIMEEDNDDAIYCCETIDESEVSDLTDEYDYDDQEELILPDDEHDLIDDWNTDINEVDDDFDDVDVD